MLTRVAGSVSAVAAVVALAFSVYFFVDATYAKRASVTALEVEAAIEELEQITLEEKYMPDVYPSEIQAYRSVQKERLKRKVKEASK